MSWEECQEYLPSERRAVHHFLKALEDGHEPPPGAFQGRGIVMSGGPSQLLQALANLHVLRNVLGSELPVEFWHAFELREAHCEALAALGATCRQLQVPGVYPHWQTTTPAILSSSFREVLWIDTDITPLVRPERLFETEAFRREGALFWPDLWGIECSIWGQTAWDGHIAWHLLDLAHNKSDPHCIQEHETGHFLVDKERHWKPLCLAHYLATRHFFTKVLWGYKDVFRFAWLKLNASNWYSPVRPGLVGSFIHKRTFQAISLMHFWPGGDEMGAGERGRPVPLYIHQKKMPFELWHDVATFDRELGQCVNYRLAPFDPELSGAELWRVQETDPKLGAAIGALDGVWNEVYNKAKAKLEQDPRESQRELAKLHPKRNLQRNKEYLQLAKACRCDYTSNRWFQLLALASGKRGVELNCGPLQDPGLSTWECPVGFALLALLCSQRSLAGGDVAGARTAAGTVARLLPEVSGCLSESFWPMETADLERFIQEADLADARSETEPVWRGSLRIREDRLADFPATHRRCVPFRDPLCWNWDPDTLSDDLAPESSCFNCCDRGMRGESWHKLCFDAVFTEERCCNPA